MQGQFICHERTPGGGGGGIRLHMNYNLQFIFIRFIQIRMQILIYLQKNGDLNAQFMNEDFKAQFIRLETS